jgi:hypothetical protein
MHLNARPKILVPVLLLLAIGGAFGAWKAGLLKSFTTGGSGKTSSAYFEDFTAESGVAFQQWCGDSGAYFFPEIMGSGLALFDYDRDGDLDLYIVQAMPRKAAADRKPIGGRQPSPTSRLFRQGSDGRFTDVTEEAGLLDHEAYGVGVAAGDVNNDGWPDLYVSKYGSDRLYLNHEGQFEDVTETAGISNLRWGTSACFFDYDRDGWLDLLVANYVDYFPSQHCIPPNGNEDFCHPVGFSDSPAKLFRNVSGEMRDSQSAGSAVAARFKDVSLESGISSKQGPGLGVLPADYNGDGWLDVYVANDSKANFLWINQKNGTFVEDAIAAGCAYDAAGRPQSSMGVAWGDVNADGLSDLFMTHFGSEYHTLYVQSEGNLFEDRTLESGLVPISLPYTGFGTAFVDLDLDGDCDIPVVDGRVTRRASDRQVDPTSLSFWDSYAERNQLLLGNGDGTFQEVQPGAEPFLSVSHVARGLAAGDLDNDGDMDLVSTEVNGPVRIYRNVASRQGNWLLVRAVDPALGGRDAYGAQITVVASKRTWQRDINPAYSYLTSNDPRAHFGVGQTENVDHIDVLWPDGTREVFAGGNTNRLVEVRKGEGDSP